MSVPSLIWVTDRQRAARPLAEIARDAVAGGIDAIQIRERDLSEAELLRLCTEVRDAAGDHAIILVNGALEIAEQLGIGLHLPERMDIAAARDRLGPKATISRSVHSADAARSSSAATFVIAGHLFATASHPGEAPLGVDGLRQIVDPSPVPVIAIGGIDASNAADAIRAGAAGVAVLSAINQADDPAAAAVAIRAAIRPSEDAAMTDASTIAITLNGRPAEVPAGCTIQALIDLKSLRDRLVVVERNGAIVNRSTFTTTTLATGDEIEIVHFVGGG